MFIYNLKCNTLLQMVYQSTDLIAVKKASQLDLKAISVDIICRIISTVARSKVNPRWSTLAYKPNDLWQDNPIMLTQTINAVDIHWFDHCFELLDAKTWLKRQAYIICLWGGVVLWSPDESRHNLVSKGVGAFCMNHITERDAEIAKAR